MAVYFLVVGLAAELLSLVETLVSLPDWLKPIPAAAEILAVFLIGAALSRIAAGIATLTAVPVWRRTGFELFLLYARAAIGAGIGAFILWKVLGGFLPEFRSQTTLIAALLAFAYAVWHLHSRRGLMRGIMIDASSGGAIEVQPRQIMLAATTGTGRRIAIFCDGTSNSPDQIEDGKPAQTNICRMYEALEKNETQTGWYDPGVGTDTSSNSIRAKMAQSVFAEIGFRRTAGLMGVWRKIRISLEAAFGMGITENIVQAYAAIARAYRPGDAIYLFGFSRGAYTARCVAGVIARCGSLRAENAALAPHVVALYRTRKETANDVPLSSLLIHRETPRVEMLGVFDTVGSLGVPMWGWWFNFGSQRNKALNTNPAPICEHIYHAMAMDERRAQFFPTPFDKPIHRPGSAAQHLTQIWFRGAHADIGGGYARRGLSDIALDWMISAARRHGLSFAQSAVATIAPDPLEIPHDEMDRALAWKAGGSWPRWHPIPGETRRAIAPPSDVHPSVLIRAKALNAMDRRDLSSIPEGDRKGFSAAGTRQWNDSGIVIESGGVYRIVADPKFQWRDAGCPPCGAAGQNLGFSFADFIRLVWAGFKRLPREKYMTLCVIVAHPRAWPLHEFGIWRLLKYLIIRDPVELARQVAAIGRHMANGTPIYIRNDALGGVLHTFANDLWLTDANNAGALKLTIERVAAPGTDGKLWVLNPDGGWSDPDKSPAKMGKQRARGGKQARDAAHA